MPKSLLKDKPYERFSSSYETGLAPGVSVTLHLPVSGRKITDRRALIDTGSEITSIYPRDVKINISSDTDTPRDVDRDPDTDLILVGVEIEGQIYYVRCEYSDHPYGGSEHMLIGMDILSNWLVKLHGKNHLLSVTHL